MTTLIVALDREPGLADTAITAARAEGARATLFVDGEFKAHSGATLPYKIDCDALTDADLVTLAADAARRFRFRGVYGVPRGGLRFAAALQKYQTESPLDPLLIVDDVLTTGASMEEARARDPANTIGVVIFARGPCPDWINPLFGDYAQARAEGARLMNVRAVVAAQRVLTTGGTAEAVLDAIRALPETEQTNAPAGDVERANARRVAGAVG